MAGCSSCGGSDAARAILRAKGLGGEMDPAGQSNLKADKVRMEFIGPQVGATSFTVHGHTYRAGNNPLEKYVDVDPDDVNYLELSSKFRVVAVPKELANPAPARSQVPATAPVPMVPQQVENAEASRQRAESAIMAARAEMEAAENDPAEAARWKAIEEKMARERLNQHPMDEPQAAPEKTVKTKRAGKPKAG